MVIGFKSIFILLAPFKIRSESHVPQTKLICRPKILFQVTRHVPLKAPQRIHLLQTCSVGNKYRMSRDINKELHGTPLTIKHFCVTKSPGKKCQRTICSRSNTARNCIWTYCEENEERCTPHGSLLFLVNPVPTVCCCNRSKRKCRRWDRAATPTVALLWWSDKLSCFNTVARINSYNSL